MKLYLDTCCLNRPFDDHSQPRVALESQAILAILSKCEAGVFGLVSSEVVQFENSKNPFPQKKAYVDSVIRLAGTIFQVTDQCESRAIELELRGFKSFDALQVNLELMTTAEITTEAIKLLCREIGPVNTARFINQFSSGTGDYTQDRSRFLGDRSVQDIVSEIKIQRTQP
ncbi:hypothetical protein SH449x_000246 [Pirellulaceae bacterium SH449]